MNFIKKAIEEKKLIKQLEFERSVCPEIPTINVLIGNIKKCNSVFARKEKNTIAHHVDGFIWYLNTLDSAYTKFLYDLNMYQEEYKKSTGDAKIAVKANLDCMLQKKKEYRANFESIYNNFKRISKGNDFPKRNEILSKMRTTFDFDSSKYYAHDQFVLMR